MDSTELEIAKSIFNHKKAAILRAVNSEPKTVKEIAKKLNEKVSRLYYHINQLEELGLLVIEREEMVGNLSQKYYIAKNIQGQVFTFNKETASDNKEFIMSQLYAYTNDSLSTIHSDLIHSSDEKDTNSEASVLKVKLTKNEWRELCENIRKLISEAQNRPREDQDELVDVNYVLLSHIVD